MAKRSRIVPRPLALLLGVVVLLALCGAYAGVMPGRSHTGPLPRATPEQQQLALELERHVQQLASEIGERRAVLGDSLARAAEYLEKQLVGLERSGKGQVKRESLGAPGLEAQNLIWELPGSSRELVLVGAHYDSAHGTPGANDNASGVAAALVLARRLSSKRLRKTLRFVLFANEELPYFEGPGMGSLVHARGCRARGEQVAAMLALESLGFYSERPKSQRYPVPIQLAYPDTGNFIGFVGNLGSRALVRRSIGAFRRSAAFPSEGAALPAQTPGVGWSDHSSFWQLDYPAIMVTDTAVFRDPHYHEPTDLPAHLDFERLARVTLGLQGVLEELAEPAAG